MLTKSVAICVVGSWLAGIILPGDLFVTPAHAKSKTAKSSRTASHACAAPHLVQQGHKHHQPSHKKGKVASAPMFPPSSASPQGTSHNPQTRALGTFTVRAYTHHQRSVGALSKTASGTLPTAGRTVAVDPQVIPLGSKIHIAGVGERIAEDSGGRIKGKVLDLFLPSVEHCRQFGVRLRDVQVVLE